jgi:glycine betaine/proline transport system substrate-binding protein
MAAGLAAVSLTAAACGGDGETQTSADGGSADSGNCESVTLGFIPSWTDTLKS